MADRGDYHELAAQCVREAGATSGPETRAFLLMMAQAWMKLAARHDQMQSLTDDVAKHTGREQTEF